LFEAVCDADYHLLVAAIPFHIDISSLAAHGRAEVTRLDADKVSLLREFLSTGRFTLALHGYAHLASAPARGLAEFSDRLTEETHRALLERGREELEDRFQTTVSVFVPPWNSLGDTAARIVASMGMSLAGADATLPVAARAGSGCIPFDASIVSTDRALHLAGRHGGSIVGTTLHDYDFAEVGFRGEFFIRDMKELLERWRKVSAPSSLPEADQEAFSVSRTSANLAFRQRVVSGHLPGRFSRIHREVYWSESTARALHRRAALVP